MKPVRNYVNGWYSERSNEPTPSARMSNRRYFAINLVILTTLSGFAYLAHVLYPAGAYVIAFWLGWLAARWTATLGADL